MAIDDIKQIIVERLAQSGYYLISATIDNGVVDVVIDNNDGVSLDFCGELNTYLRDSLGAAADDLEISVSSAGLTSDFVVREQYVKNLGNDVVLLTLDGKKIRGVLKNVGDEDFTIGIRVKKAVEGSKRKVEVEEDVVTRYDNVKSIRYDLVF